MADGRLYGFDVEEFLIALLMHAFARMYEIDVVNDYIYEEENEKAILIVNGEEVVLDFCFFQSLAQDFEYFIRTQLHNSISRLGEENIDPSSDCCRVSPEDLDEFYYDYPITFYWDTESSRGDEKHDAVDFYSRRRFLGSGRDRSETFLWDTYSDLLCENVGDGEIFTQMFPSYEIFKETYLAHVGEVSAGEIFLWT